MEWLTAEGETPRRFAALVKLRSSATMRNTDNALRSFIGICELTHNSMLICGPSQTRYLPLLWR
jgi:hypothetical protein